MKLYRTVLLVIAAGWPMGATAQELQYCAYSNYGTKGFCYMSATACQSAISYSLGSQCYAEVKAHSGFSAAVEAANKASQSDIEYREFRDDALNRKEQRELEMERLRRAEREAQAQEAERLRALEMTRADRNKPRQ